MALRKQEDSSVPQHTFVDDTHKVLLHPICLAHNKPLLGATMTRGLVNIIAATCFIIYSITLLGETITDVTRL